MRIEALFVTSLCALLLSCSAHALISATGRKSRRRGAPSTNTDANAVDLSSSRGRQSSSMMRDRLQLKVIEKEMSVVFFPTAAHLEATNSSTTNNNNATWIVPIHGWIFNAPKQRRGLRRKAFLSLLRSGLQRNTKQVLSDENEESEQEEEEACSNGDAVVVLNDNNNVDDLLDDDEEAEEQALLAAAADAQASSSSSSFDAKANKAAVKEILARRVNPFIVDNHRRRKITIQFNKTTDVVVNGDDPFVVRELPQRSRKNGHFHATLRFTQQELQQVMQTPQPTTEGGTGVIQFQAVTGLKKDTRCFQGTCHVLAPPPPLDATAAGPQQPSQPQHISIVSDIDDTIKVSHVLDKKRLVRHTFLEEFQAVTGMPELYAAWKERYHTNNIFFHYVSSSPWQLYPEIAAFLQTQGFPNQATFSLKSIRLKDRTLLNLFADPVASKLSKISSLLETYPHRRFCLVGDTGERDPEVYGELCRRFPQQVEKVFLRDVTSRLTNDKIAKINAKHEKRAAKKKLPDYVRIDDPDRYARAFDNVPAEKWHIFTDPTSLVDISLLPDDDKKKKNKWW